ncbi:hypothetical protein INR49_018742, partial [Caranx melampygus]
MADAQSIQKKKDQGVSSSFFLFRWYKYDFSDLRATKPLHFETAASPEESTDRACMLDSRTSLGSEDGPVEEPAAGAAAAAEAGGGAAAGTAA